LFIGLIAAAIYYIQSSRGGKKIYLRKLAAVDAIGDMVGRSAEMGKSIVAAQTMKLTSDYAPQIIAGLNTIEYLARQCANHDVPLIITSDDQATYEAVVDIVDTTYKASGKRANLDNLQFYAHSSAHRAATIGIIAREKPGGFLQVGAIAGESLMFLEAAKRYGALSIAGTARTIQLAFVVVAADYALIGEEIIALGAYLSGDPIVVGSLAAEDIGKYITIVLLVIGYLVFAAGSSAIKDLIVT
jgi:hypothetical protein